MNFAKRLSIAGIALFATTFANADVTVFAASSMTNALQTAKQAFQKTHPDTHIQLSFASSSKLARQIENGAPANIFISADQKWMNYLAEKQLIAEQSRVDIARNRLVLIVPKDSKVTKVNLRAPQWTAYLGDGRLAIGEPNAVPAGRYAKQALTAIHAWHWVEKKLAPAANVRVALSYVERGETPMGIVYATDAKLTDKVRVLAEFPKSSYEPITYPAALVKGQDNAESQAFLAFLRSDEGQKIFAQYGFMRP